MGVELTEEDMLSTRIGTICGKRALRTYLSVTSQGGGKSLYRDNIKKDNPFWFRHQVEAKGGYNKQIFSERVLSAALFFSIPASVICPGNVLLDCFITTGIMYHAHQGIAHMIGDYVPLVLPALKQPLKLAWKAFAVLTAIAWIVYNI